jgi:hypothetical protein
MLGIGELVRTYLFSSSNRDTYVPCHKQLVPPNTTLTASFVYQNIELKVY